MADPVQQVLDWLDTYDTPHANVAHLLCDRHPADRVAVTEVSADLTTRDLTYGELADHSTRRAAALAAAGVTPGDRVATFMEKGHDLVVTALAIWRLGAVYVPLYTGLAPSVVTQRLTDSAAHAVVCDAEQAAKLRQAGPAAGRVLVVGARIPAGDTDLDGLAGGAAPEAVAVGGAAPFVLLYTSSPAGQPRGVPVPVRALAALHSYHVYGLDVRAGDVYWNATDPGWSYGLYHGVVSPLLAGDRTIMLRAGFDAELTLDVLSMLGVSNFTAAPTVYRALRAAVKSLPPDIVARRLSSAGEPLTPEVARWAADAFGVAIHDTYGQTELGICVAAPNHPDAAVEVEPGSVGVALPGWRVVVLDPVDDIEVPVGEVGRIAVDADPKASPAMWFSGYYRDAVGTFNRFSADGRWYLTGDAGRRDASGRVFLSSRDDDVIVTGGYRVSPFDVESALLRHSAVIETAAYGVPDEIFGSVVAASVVLHEGCSPSEELAAELTDLVRTGCGEHARPRRVMFVSRLPKSASGKIQRGRLRRI